MTTDIPRANTLTMQSNKVVLSDDEDDEYLDELASDDEDMDIKDLGAPNVILRGKLPPPRPSPLSTKQIHDMIHFGNVNLNPDYQRDVVWGESKMIMLIQSLFLNYYVPPVIFAKTVDQDGNEIRVAIDGKQRCTSILWFMDGKIPFVAPNKQKFWYTTGDWQRGGKALPANLKRMFETISIQTVEYDGIDQETQRDIFQRVQLGMALNAAEKLAAIPGPWSTWIVSLQKRFVDEEGTLGNLLTWDTKRSLPFKSIAAVIIFCFEPERHSPPTPAHLTKFLSRADPPSESFQKKIEMTFSLFVNIATDHATAAFHSVKSQRVAPVEFWFIGLIIFRRMGSTSISDLARIIGDMRKYIRAKHRDVFSNNKVVLDLYNWFDKLPVIKPARGEQIAAVEWSGEDVETTESLAKKRKREQREAEADPDFHGPALRRGLESAPTEGLRSKVSQLSVSSSRNGTKSSSNHSATPSPRSFQPRPVVPAASVRPPPPLMDAPAPDPYGNNFNYQQPNGMSNLPRRPEPLQARPTPQQIAQLQQQQARNQQFANQVARGQQPAAQWGPNTYYQNGF